MLYMERHAGKTKPYRITRGSITRDERDEKGNIRPIRYGVGDIVHLTEAGAAGFPGLVKMATRGDVPEVVTKAPKSAPEAASIVVPDDWQDMRKADLLALAAAIGNVPVNTTAKAKTIIQEYIDGLGATDGQ